MHNISAFTELVKIFLIKNLKNMVLRFSDFTIKLFECFNEVLINPRPWLTPHIPLQNISPAR